MDSIRLATAEEIDKIKQEADLGPGCSVVTFGGKEFAVIRQVTEVDPMWFSETTSDQRKLLFAWGIETALRIMGCPQYYFNINAEDTKWQGVVKTNGSEQVSPTPELRFKKAL